MALVKFPEGQQRSGKQGGIVWSRNRFGAYARNRAVPVNPDSAKQRSVRNRFTTNAKSWQALSTSEKLTWNQMAANLPKKNRLGDTIFLTGFQTYIASNQNLWSFGVNLSSPGFVTPSPFPTDVILSANPGLILVTTAGDLPATYGIVIEATAPVSYGVTSGTVKSKYKQITTLAPDTTLGASLDLSDVYVDVFGPATANTQIFIRYQWVSMETGQVSGWETLVSEN